MDDDPQEESKQEQPAAAKGEAEKKPEGKSKKDKQGPQPIILEEHEMVSAELDKIEKRLKEVGGKQKGYRKKLREEFNKYRGEAEDALKGLFDDDLTQMLAGKNPQYAVSYLMEIIYIIIDHPDNKNKEHWDKWPA